ncbi:MAG: hypothetical protein K8T90_00975, partial [Planctomycetes bacterium]|nr:hypothetical protein [Planctomycetota bacterium]
MPTTSAAESTIVFLPRFTTLVGPGTYTTQPLDVSQFASAQFQAWRGVQACSSGLDATKVKVFLEESLDCQDWVLGASAPRGITIPYTATRLFSYGFRLRWFRLRVEITAPGTGDVAGLVTMWAEGILRHVRVLSERTHSLPLSGVRHEQSRYTRLRCERGRVRRSSRCLGAESVRDPARAARAPRRPAAG